MSTFRLLFSAFSIAAIVGCGAASPPIAAGAPQLSSATRTGARYAYVSDTFANRIDVYAWSVPGMKRGTYIRSLNLTEPFGGCADNRGNVYITHLSQGNGEIVEYRGDSGRRLRHLQDPGSVPFDCAVDPTTDSIAVANIGLAISFGEHGSVWVYPGGFGPPVQFVQLPSAAGTLQAIYFVVYDDDGKLYVDGSVAPCFSFTDCAPAGDAHVDILSSCCSASSAFVPVSLKGDPLLGIEYPGALIWDGKHLDVGDRQAAPGLSPHCDFSQGCAALYEAREGGSPAEPTLTGKGLTSFEAIEQAWGVALADGKTVATNFVAQSEPPIQVYDYPAGGEPVSEWPLPGSAQTPAFVTISR